MKKFLFVSLIVAIAIITIAIFTVVFITQPNESNAECKFWGNREAWIEECWEEWVGGSTWVWEGKWGGRWELFGHWERKCRTVAILEYACIEEGGEWGQGEVKGETIFGGCGDCGSCNDSRYRWCISTAYGDGTCADYTCDCRPDLCNGGGGGDGGGSSPPPPPPPPSPGDFNLSQGAIVCNSVGLSWIASSGADGYKILRGSPRVDISPYQPYTAQNFTDTSVSQNTSYQYQIEAYNAGGTNRSNEINVTTPYCQPTVNLSANPTSIYQGQASTLSWSSSYADDCSASGSWSGSKALSGSEIVIPSPPPSTTYNLTCSGPGGSALSSVTINITPLFLPNWREIIPR